MHKFAIDPVLSERLKAERGGRLHMVDRIDPPRPRQCRGLGDERFLRDHFCERPG
jgi:hypothetical protein